MVSNQRRPVKKTVGMKKGRKEGGGKEREERRKRKENDRKSHSMKKCLLCQKVKSLNSIAHVHPNFIINKGLTPERWQEPMSCWVPAGCFSLGRKEIKLKMSGDQGLKRCHFVFRWPILYSKVALGHIIPITLFPHMLMWGHTYPPLTFWKKN